MTRSIVTKAFSSFTLLAGLIAAAPAAAQDESFELEGSVRLRYETFDGGFRPGGQESDEAVLTRSLVKARYSRDNFRLGVTLQDSRGWGIEESSPLGASDINTLELIELFATVDLSEHASLTLGRQTLNLGSKRLVGNPNFRNAANGFTGARIDWESTGGGTLTAFYLLPQQRLPSVRSELVNNAVEWDREDEDLAFWGAFYELPVMQDLSIEAYVLGLSEDDAGDMPTFNRNLVTPGLRLLTAPRSARFDIELEAMYQTGNIRASKAADAARLDVSAFSLHSEIGYTFDGDARPRLSVFYDLATGDDGAGDTYNRFDPLFGPRYGDWGPSGLFGPLGRTNISSLGAMISARVSSRIDAQLQYRRNWLESATDPFSKTGVRDTAGASGTDAGSQIQGRLRWWIVPDLLRLEVGGAWLDKGEFFDTAPNDPGNGDTRYAYSMMEISF